MLGHLFVESVESKCVFGRVIDISVFGFKYESRCEWWIGLAHDHGLLKGTIVEAVAPLDDIRANHFCQ